MQNIQRYIILLYENARSPIIFQSLFFLSHLTFSDFFSFPFNRNKIYGYSFHCPDVIRTDKLYE